jgi:hypothetical protein
MAEVAGSNPAEPIVLFRVGDIEAVYLGFVFYENYEDPRTFFTIDVSDLDEAARTEREYILRKLGLAERELEAFNFEIKEHTRRFTTTGARPSDHVAAMLQERREEERTVLEERARDLEKTVLDLRKRLALLDTWRDGSEVQQYIRSMKKALNESNFFDNNQTTSQAVRI